MLSGKIAEQFPKLKKVDRSTRELKSKVNAALADVVRVRSVRLSGGVQLRDSKKRCYEASPDIDFRFETQSDMYDKQNSTTEQFNTRSWSPPTDIWLGGKGGRLIVSQRRHHFECN